MRKLRLQVPGYCHGGGEEEPHIGYVFFQDKGLGSDFAEFIEIMRRLKIDPKSRLQRSLGINKAPGVGQATGTVSDTPLRQCIVRYNIMPWDC
jgi:hypothetical protein